MAGRPSQEKITKLESYEGITIKGERFGVTKYIKKDDVICYRKSDMMQVHTTWKDVERGTVNFPISNTQIDYKKMAQELMPYILDELHEMFGIQDTVQHFTNKSWTKFIRDNYPDISEALDFVPTGTRVDYDPEISLDIDIDMNQEVVGTADKKGLDTYLIDKLERWPFVCEKLNIPEFSMKIHLGNHFKQNHFKWSIDRLRANGVEVEFQN